MQVTPLKNQRVTRFFYTKHKHPPCFILNTYLFRLTIRKKHRKTHKNPQYPHNFHRH